MQKPTQTTIHWMIKDTKKDAKYIKDAGNIIAAGGLVAFPTETVYGLGANALKGPAVKRIFQAKGRPADNPLIVHVADPAEVEQMAHLNDTAIKLMQTFWPGPLTLVLPKKPTAPDEVTAGLDTVAVRMPSHPVALALIKAAGVPIAAPSANLSGRPSPTTVWHVLEDMTGKIAGVLDGGSCQLGVESTVLDVSDGTPTILRPGGVTAEQLQPVLGVVNYDPALENHRPKGDIKPRSPGVKYKHYAPKAEVILLEGSVAAVVDQTRQLLNQYQATGKRVGLLTSAENVSQYNGALTLTYGSRQNPATAAAGLYASLREFDRLGVDIIIAEGIPDTGLGRAVMDRMRRAASGNIRVL